MWGKSAYLVLVLFAAACGSSDEPGGGPGADAAPPPPPSPDAGPAPDPTVAIFAPDHIVDVAIELAPADWEALRTQTRSIFDVLGSTCLSDPPPSPFTWFAASVTIDGQAADMIAVRKKGFFGSLSETKPSLKVKLDEFVPGQALWGVEDLTLNNAISDPAYLKQCLGYQLFAAAGVPAPRCNFARVSVNGQPLGLYVHVEAIKKAFLARHFADDGGNLYEGALSDFRPGWVETFQKKTNETDPDRSDLEGLVPLMDLPDGQLLPALETELDLDAFVTFWAMELLVAHADGYARNTNNFYLYHDPSTGLAHFIPWGIDAILVEFGALPWESEPPPVAIWAEGVLARRLYLNPDGRARYVARVRELLDSVWLEDEILAEIDRMEALITPEIPLAERAGFAGAVDGVRGFVLSQRGRITAALDGGPEPWSQPLRDPWCVDPIGTTSATFATTFGTLEAPDPFAAGTGSFAVDYLGMTLPIGQVGSTAGIDPDSGLPAVRVFAWTSATELLVAHVAIDADLFVSGGVAELDWVAASGYLVKLVFAPGVDPQVVVMGLLGDGLIQLSQAGLAPGTPVVGSFDSVVYENIF